MTRQRLTALGFFAFLSAAYLAAFVVWVLDALFPRQESN